MFGQAKKALLAHLLPVQGATIMLSVVLSALVFFPLATITFIMSGQCLLFSKLYLSTSDFTLRYPAKINLTGTEYGPMEECDYTTFLHVTVTVAGLIFLWFLIHLGRVSEFQKSESGFLLSLLLFYLVLLVCVFVASVKITAGFSYWCHNLYVCIGTEEYSTECRPLACDQFSQVTLEDIPEDTSRIYAYFLTAQISSWLLTVTLLFECFVTSQRIYNDIASHFVDETSKIGLNEIVPPVSLKAGIINQGSDEFDERSQETKPHETPTVVKRTLTAEVTVHELNVTSSIEMRAIASKSYVQPVLESEVTGEDKEDNQEYSNSRDTPKSRKRQMAKKYENNNEITKDS